MGTQCKQLPLESESSMQTFCVSVVVPCFNESEVLPEFHRRTSAACELLGKPYELILVNDGSTDNTWEVMLDLSANDLNLVCVNLSRNHGHQLAMTAGLSVCRAGRVLIIDADLQDPPELLHDMMEIMDGGADVVFGKRRERAGESKFKLSAAWTFYWLIGRLTDSHIDKNVGDFRLISRRVLEILLSLPERHRFTRGLVSWIGFNQQPILYDRDPRYAGTTKYPIRRMVSFAMDGITSFSTKPLTIASYVGLASAGLAFVMVIYAFIGWRRSGVVNGWTSLMVGISLLGGLQLFVLGIMGEYLGRLAEQVKGRPLFLVDKIVSGGASPNASAAQSIKTDATALATAAENSTPSPQGGARSPPLSK